jgi:hypothetical protein
VGGVEIAFPNGALVTAIPGFWRTQGKWYLDVIISGADAYEGIMGALARQSGLPALRDGSSLGLERPSASARYPDLTQRLAESWRVTSSSSLFDYPHGNAANDLINQNWPKESGACDFSAHVLNAVTVQNGCKGILDPDRRNNCLFDVAATGEPEFANTYLLAQRLEMWRTATTMVDQEGALADGRIVLAAKVVPQWRGAMDTPTGAIQFYVDGNKMGSPVELPHLDGLAMISVPCPLKSFNVYASFVPSNGTSFLPSRSAVYVVNDRGRLVLPSLGLD